MAWSDTVSGFFFLWKKKKPLQKEKPAPLGILASESSALLPHPWGALLSIQSLALFRKNIK
jgi:hypothetical protein